MPISFTDPDEWYAEYQNATPEGEQQLILQTVSLPLSEDFLEGLDLTEVLLDHMHGLDRRNRNGELISLIEQFRDGQPDLYREEFYYFDQYLFDYYLYLDQMEKLGGSLSRFAADPASGIDYMLKALELLKLYQKTDLVVDLCDRTYQAVKDSKGVVSGCEDRLGETIYFYRVEQLYRRLQAGRQIDWPGSALPLAKFGFLNASQMQADLTHYLGSEVPGPDGFLDLLQQSGPGGYWFLAYDFYKYMLDQKGMGFVSSNLIWEETVEFWKRREYSFPGKDGLDQFFDFPEQKLDIHLANLLNGFLSKRQPNAVALLWGLPYVYEFLLNKEIVSGALYRDVLDKVALLKAKLVVAYPYHLWKYDFVHRWAPPGAVSAEEFASEAALFADTFRRIIPLDDPPASDFYECEEAETQTTSPPWDFADSAGTGLFSGNHHYRGPTKKKLKPKKKTKPQKKAKPKRKKR
jgi:hypothetical protein